MSYCTANVHFWGKADIDPQWDQAYDDELLVCCAISIVQVNAMMFSKFTYIFARGNVRVHAA